MACFLIPAYEKGGSPTRNTMVVVMVTVFYIGWGMSYTAGDIPLWSISALMTEDEKHRQKLQAAARIAAGVGAGVCILGFQPIALATGQGLLAKKAATYGISNLEELAAQAKALGVSVSELAAQHGFVDYTKEAIATTRLGCILVAFVLTIVSLVTFQMAGIFAREKIAPKGKGNSVLQNFKMMWRNKPFRQLLISGVLSAPRQLTMFVAIPMVTYYFANANPVKATLYLVLIGGGLFIGMFVATAFVPKLLDRFSKKNVYNFSNLLEMIPNISVFVLYIISLRVNGGLTNIVLLIPAIILFAVKGIALGLFNTLQTAMIADAVDYEDYTTRNRPDGVFFSGQTFMTKIGTGISNIIYGTLCSLVAFEGRNVQTLQDMIAEHKVPRELMQRGSDVIVHTMHTFLLDGTAVSGTLTGGQLFNFFTLIFFVVSIIPAIGNVLAIIPTWHYALDTETYSDIKTKLQARRREEGGLTDE
jgi:Na+/melibiose symporter-like transporter